VKRRDLETRLRALGWSFQRHGGSHDIWGRGLRIMAIPRHNEIKENTARAILREAAKE
jgi:mRNA interferase HicA